MKGLLPLHLEILECAGRCDDGGEDDGRGGGGGTKKEGKETAVAAVGIIEMFLKMFPGALVVADNDGNLPLHLAVMYLSRNIGSDVVYMLMNEAAKQGRNLRLQPMHSLPFHLTPHDVLYSTGMTKQTAIFSN